MKAYKKLLDSARWDLDNIYYIVNIIMLFF